VILLAIQNYNSALFFQKKGLNFLVCPICHPSIKANPCLLVRYQGSVGSFIRQAPNRSTAELPLLIAPMSSPTVAIPMLAVRAFEFKARLIFMHLLHRIKLLHFTHNNKRS